ADRAVYHSGLLHRRHLDGRAYFFGHTAFGEGGRYRFALVRHIRSAGGRDGADYAAGGLQPVRAARPHRQGHVLRRARLAALLHPDGAGGRDHLEVSRNRHLSAGKDVQSELILRQLAARPARDLLREPVTLLLGAMPALPIYTTPAIRKLEELAAPASGTLMERAGAAAAEFARDLCGDTAKAILVVDVPSGIDADTGAIMGCAVRASHTLTFIAHKPGLLTLDGPDHCGELKLDTLGLDPVKLLEPEGMLFDADILDRAVAPRRRNFHK